MMTHETADWVNRVGLTLGFLAFWFAAPEFIGETRLRKWEQALGKSLLKLPFIGKATMAITFTYIIGLYAYRWIASGRRGTLPVISPAQLTTLGIVAGTALLFEYFRPLVSKLANHERVRQRSLF